MTVSTKKIILDSEPFPDTIYNSRSYDYISLAQTKGVIPFGRVGR
ncbi:MAG TPA: hypothetical protein VH796_15080 [Nitrososphaeraceae archaeon]